MIPDQTLPFDAQVNAFIGGNEGRIAMMYADGGDVVTAGIGHALFTAASARMLDFLKGPISESLSTPATLDEITAEWERVKSGKLAPHRTDPSALVLPPAEIDRVFAADMVHVYATARWELPNFDYLPNQARLAVLDLDFNLGSLIHRPPPHSNFEHLHAAIEARNWSLAAANCQRLDVSAERNQDTMKLFLSCLNMA